MERRVEFNPLHQGIMGEIRVNGQLIEEGWIEQEFQSIKAEYERLGNVSCCERDDEFRGYARENIIAQVLISQEAERVIPEPSAEEVEREFQVIADQNGGEINFLSLHGLAQDQKTIALEGLAKQIRTRKLTEQIQSPLPEFGEKAQQYSEKPVDEADLGFFKRGELMEEFEMVVFSMTDGEVSPVFLSPHGMHVAKRVESTNPQLKPFQEVQNQVLELLLEDWKEARLQEAVERLKSEAQIEEAENTETEPADA